MNLGLAFLLVALAAVPLAAQSSPTAAAVLRTVQREGAPAAVAQYFLRDSAFGDAILDSIAAGGPDWLRVARRLRRAADAGVGESLVIAVADALPVAPARVLALLGTDFPTARVCGLPFIEQSDADEAEYYQRATRALRSVHGTTLRSRRMECLAALRRTHAGPRAPAA